MKVSPTIFARLIALRGIGPNVSNILQAEIPPLRQSARDRAICQVPMRSLAAGELRPVLFRSGGVSAVETFAAGLEQDRAAVRAALTTPWSNGQAEGQITRLKLLKRQMYGRAGFDLLRRRVLLAP
jgi:hypothetical protein